MANKKLIAVDIDGTIATDGNMPSAFTIETLRKINSLGHTVVLSSGRPYRNLEPIYREIGCTGPVICFNGALVFHPIDPTFPKLEFVFSGKDVREIFFASESFLQSFSCETESVLYDYFDDGYIGSFFPREGKYDLTGDGKAMVFEGETIYREIAGSHGLRGYLWNKLFKRELIHTPLDESLLQCEDLLFCAQNLEGVRRAAYLSEPLYRYTRKADGEELSIKRGLSLADAQEKLLAVYREKAPGSAYIPERNLLKTFLYLRAKAKQEHERDEAVLSRIRSGIKTHFCRVMREKDVSVKTKGNIVLTYLFPCTSLRIKQRILKKRHQNGIWES